MHGGEEAGNLGIFFNKGRGHEGKVEEGVACACLPLPSHHTSIFLQCLQHGATRTSQSDTVGNQVEATGEAPPSPHKSSPWAREVVKMHEKLAKLANHEANVSQCPVPPFSFLPRTPARFPLL